jgi:hypothetical protein
MLMESESRARTLNTDNEIEISKLRQEITDLRKEIARSRDEKDYTKLQQNSFSD